MGQKSKKIGRAISCGKNSYFYGSSGKYTEVMSQAIVKLARRPTEFQNAFAILCEARRAVLVEDARARFLKGESSTRMGDDLDHLREFDLYRKLRVKNKTKKNFSNCIGETGPYRPFFLFLERKCSGKNWKPALPASAPKSIVAPWRIKRISPQYFRLTHSRPADVPKILRHCEKLWSRALQSKSPNAAMKDIAEFEWWFFAANPTGRCGASLGLCLSVVLQLSTRNRSLAPFQHADWRSLSMELSDYQKWRLKKPKSPKRQS